MDIDMYFSDLCLMIFSYLMWGWPYYKVILAPPTPNVKYCIYTNLEIIWEKKP